MKPRPRDRFLWKTYECVRERKQTTAIKRDGAVAVLFMKQDSYVCSAVVHLSEGQSCHVAPVLEGRTDGRPDL